MKAIVVYESLFGNTGRVAGVIARCLETVAEVELASVLDADPQGAAGVDLVVVGGPTHMHGMSWSFTRKSTVDKDGNEAAATGPGVREWLDKLPKGNGILAAAFDTRADGSRLLLGAASEPIARRLRKHGYRLIVPPESFIVTDTEGPLKAGEVERADAWAHRIAQQLEGMARAPAAAAS
jgi:hypothetical protein